MTASSLLKGLLATAATVALAGVAIAQGTPPAPGATDPAVGAGQRSTQNTPMGSTGTPGGGGAAGATAGGAQSGSTGMGTGTGSTMSGSMGSTGGGTAAAGTSSAGSRSGQRASRADRG